MLQLQRASAGSGKTFTLAKKFIWFFITIRPEGEPRRLREPAELEDSLSHILAVTFTNKATNEMQLRIVEKLFALGYPDVVIKDGKRPDYEKEFCKELGVPQSRLQQVCRRALGILLHNYSDFNVSTIDSFFQHVLRTFAYETGVNDSYQVELDTDYLTRLAVNAVLEELDTRNAKPSTLFWIRILMDREKKGWQIFQRREKGKTKAGGSYSDLIAAVARLENEDYKSVRKFIADYFAADSDLEGEFLRLQELFASRLREPRRILLEKAAAFRDSLPEEIASLTGRSTLGVFPAIARFILDSSEDSLPATTIPDLESKLSAKNFITFRKQSPEQAAFLESGAQELSQLWQDWENLLSEPAYRAWKLYEANIPYMGLFSVILDRRAAILDENNAIELGETSSILNEMIGDSDAPFIYERLGTYLNHFLIDEFQDTSRLQWANLKPLLAESMSRENDNLIIGDAKQSIYRFRNADPSLITDVVPAQFAGRVSILGDAPEHNTNWRSRINVIRFNNSLFSFLADSLDSKYFDLSPSRLSFRRLYSNTIQPPGKKAVEDGVRGYVEAVIYEKNPETLTHLVESIPSRILSITARGYKMRDIAVLVDDNNQAKSVINAIITHNSSCGENSCRIPFVSDQSLLVKSSKAVAVVVACLASVARGAKPSLPDEDEEKVRSVNWSDLESNLRYYMFDSPDLPTEELVRTFLSMGTDFDALRDMLSRMESVALPALVEAIVSRFVDPVLRRNDAIYLAAFQDLVLEYCEAHPTDISSFLDWWERKSLKASISSPEDTDAVRVMTIHKSKGLEFTCVIIPFANWELHDTLSSRGREWRWVRPMLPEGLADGLPPYLPVEVSEKMTGTAHESELHRYYDQYKLDNVNRAYVGFTRACEELYVFAPYPKAPKKADPSRMESFTIGSLLERFASRIETITPDPEGYLVDGADVSVDSRPDDKSIILRIGEQAAGPESRISEREKTADKSAAEDKREVAVLCDDYPIYPAPEKLCYRLEALPDVSEEKDSDPRSEGNLRHAALENVVTMADIPRAVRKLKIAGLLPASRVEELIESLTESLMNPDVKRWFDGSGRVLAERNILHGDYKMRRPDRIVIYDGDQVEVIDYKFGHHKPEVYSRQVKRYVDLLKDTGLFRSVRGYLWYVTLGEVSFVAD
ncbi:MAG: UvrD-helicase domain-containing protein [Muribaculaceae bacterium]|nr:UvrD-helicase domain-containing protein [Muribaculaceae bacterium]